MQQLAGVVPLVDGLGRVDALVALQPDQVAARPAGQDLRDLGLAHARLALEQQRLLQGDREMDGQGERPIGQVTLGGERGARLLH